MISEKQQYKIALNEVDSLYKNRNIEDAILLAQEYQHKSFMALKLIRMYQSTKQYQKAIELAEQYPDDKKIAKTLFYLYKTEKNTEAINNLKLKYPDIDICEYKDNFIAKLIIGEKKKLYKASILLDKNPIPELIILLMEEYIKQNKAYIALNIGKRHLRFKEVAKVYQKAKTIQKTADETCKFKQQLENKDIKEVLSQNKKISEATRRNIFLYLLNQNRKSEIIELGNTYPEDEFINTKANLIMSEIIKKDNYFNEDSYSNKEQLYLNLLKDIKENKEIPTNLEETLLEESDLIKDIFLVALNKRGISRNKNIVRDLKQRKIAYSKEDIEYKVYTSLISLSEDKKNKLFDPHIYLNLLTKANQTKKELEKGETYGKVNRRGSSNQKNNF